MAKMRYVRAFGTRTGGSRLGAASLLMPESEAQAPTRTDSHAAPLRYWAFLSYSHDDKAWADWLHKAIEGFQVPAKLVGRVTEAGPIPRRLAPVFRDRDELPAADDLGELIEDALDASRCLIVLCSPTAATSHWTNEEILQFKRRHPERPILAVIVDGEPNASDLPGREAEECFPPALRFELDADGALGDERAEPIAADAREAGDGKRLAKLKLVAGMLGVGLDELVEREAQRRQKRLAFIAVGSLAGMALTSGLAVVAVQARDEAQMQRAEAEGLVGFMLGDLRDKLAPLGRLDVLDSVGGKALGYYEKQDKDRLSEEGLAQRSKALTLIGEIAQFRGDMNGALRRYREALAGTGEAVKRAPDDPQRIFDHAQNVFWVGYIALQRGLLSEAEQSFREYKRLAQRLIALDPDEPKWRLESVYADTNLGMMLVESHKFTAATPTFRAALDDIETLVGRDPANLDYQNQLIESLAYLSQAQGYSGDLEGAMATRERQVALLDRLMGENAGNAKLKRKAAAARRAMGNLLADRGETHSGLDQLGKAKILSDELLKTEPGNTEWLQLLAGTNFDLGDLLLASGQIDAAGAAARRGCDVAGSLLRRDKSVIEWSLDAQRECLKLRAQLALAKGAHDEAMARAKELLTLRDGKERPIDAGLARAAAMGLIGDMHLAAGRGDRAATAWRQALAALPTESDETPPEQAQRSIFMRLLGMRDAADRLAARLDAIGYRHPRYVRNRAIRISAAFNDERRPFL